MLADDTALHQFLFWNGFGLAVVDAMGFLKDAMPSPPNGLTVRLATPADSLSILSLDAQLTEHLRAPSVCMRRHRPRDETRQREFICREGNTVWLSEEGNQVVGMLRMEGACGGASEIVRSPETVGISGAYVLKTHRRRGIAERLLEEAAHWYRGRGFTRCSVDWESFNPSATGFWMNRFTPVCLSVVRRVESAL